MRKSSLLGLSLLIAMSVSACGNTAQEETAEQNQTDIASEAESDTSSQEAASFSSEETEGEIVANIENLPDELEEGEKVAAVTTSEDEGIEGSLPEILVDLEALRTGNPDVCSYILVQGTDISGSVLKKTDNNDYYLEHNAQDESDPNGCICMDMGNETDFTDPVTCLYGRMGEEGAFKELVNYLDAQYMKDHDLIYVYTDDYTLEYKVFAAYTQSDTERLLVKHNFYDYAEYQQYIDEVFSVRDMTAVIDESLYDQAIKYWNIITLTGIDDDDSRMILQAVYNGRVEN
ncbi:MAG: class B sortase [Butyrivibrio sp.]|nr:class B sortase [Butyrivibrio sp.]